MEDDLKLYFIAGADSLMDIEKWKNTKEVLNSCTFVVFNRGEFNRETLKSQKEYLENKYQAEIVLLDIMSIDISSTIIRKRIKEGKRVDFFLPNKVLEYINDNEFYRGD